MRKSPIFVLFVTIFIDLLGFGLVIPILPIFSRQIGATDTEIGLIAAVYSLMNFVFAPFWGTLSDRIGRRPVILLSILLTAASYIIFAYSTTLFILFAARILGGIGSANISAAQAYISDVTAPEGRAKAMGLIGAAFGMGFIFGPPLGGYLKSISTAGTVDMVGYVSAAFCIINFIMAYFLLPESIKQKKVDMPFNFKPITSLIKQLQVPQIRELFLFNFVFIAAFSMMQITVALLWEEHNGLNEKQIGYMFAFIGLASAIVQGTLVGKLVAWFGEHKLLFIGSILMAIALFMIPFISNEYFMPFAFIAIILIALANGCLMPSITSLISQNTSEEKQGHTLGLNQSFGSVARVVGPTLGGFLYGISYFQPYIVGSMFMLGCVVLYFMLVNQKRHV
jgi:MFS transporter, DHA1 family, tetracycline resistance protein